MQYCLSPKIFCFAGCLRHETLSQMEWKKGTGILPDWLHVYSMYVLSVCLTQTFILKFFTARVLAVEKLRESFSCHLLCAIFRRPPLIGKSQGDLFRSLVEGAGKCSGMGHSQRLLPRTFHFPKIWEVKCFTLRAVPFIFFDKECAIEV